MNVLSELIHPLTETDFIEEIYGQRFYHGVGMPGRYTDLLTWHSLNEILCTHRMLPPRLRLFKNGSQINSNIFLTRQPPCVLKPKQFLSELEKGATLIIDGVDEISQPVQSLAHALQQRFVAPVNVNLYAGWKQDRGFDVHFDTQENLILQLSGRKLWKVWKPTRPQPLRPDVVEAEAPDGAPVWEGLLADGSFLFIPRGWWHVANPIDGSSLHLTVTITPYNGFDFVSWVAERCRSIELLRSNLPLWKGQEEQVRFLNLLKEEVVGLLSRTTLDAFSSAKGVRKPRYPRLALPSLEDEGLQPEDGWSGEGTMLKSTGAEVAGGALGFPEGMLGEIS